MKRRPIVKENIISKHRYYELQHMCLQYNEWKDTLRYLEAPMRNNREAGSSAVEEAAVRRASLVQKCELIEDTAQEAGEVSGGINIAEYIIKAVTNENITYRYLDSVMNIPVGKNLFYAKRRRFFILLSEKA